MFGAQTSHKLTAVLAVMELSMVLKDETQLKWRPGAQCERALTCGGEVNCGPCHNPCFTLVTAVLNSPGDACGVTLGSTCTALITVIVENASAV